MSLNGDFQEKQDTKLPSVNMITNDSLCEKKNSTHKSRHTSKTTWVKNAFLRV